MYGWGDSGACVGGVGVYRWGDSETCMGGVTVGRVWVG